MSRRIEKHLKREKNRIINLKYRPFRKNKNVLSKSYVIGADLVLIMGFVFYLSGYNIRVGKAEVTFGVIL